MRDERERSTGEVNRGLDDGLSKAFELALTPAILGTLGWLLDRRLELTPLFTLIMFFLGVIGTSLSLWYRYDAAMRAEEAAAATARAARPPRPRRIDRTADELFSTERGVHEIGMPEVAS